MEQESRSKFCSKCGGKNPVNAKFCSECGYKFSSAKGKIIAGIAILALLAIAYFLYLFFTKHSVSETTAKDSKDSIEVFKDTVVATVTPQVKGKEKNKEDKPTVKSNPQETQEIPAEKIESKITPPPSNEPQYITYPSGETYIGLLNSAGLKHGEGTYTWPSGNKYVGNFNNDKMTGKGILYFANGDISKYEGDFVNGKQHGEGTEYFKEGNIRKRTGIFKNGVANGEFVVTYKNGKTKKATWVNGKIK